MKLRRDDKVVVIAGRDKGKSGKVLSVLPATAQVIVEGINVVKRHTKPSNKQPRGGILELTKPIDAAKVMALDPATGKPARVGYQIKADGTKERVYKVSANHDRKPAVADKPAKAESKAETTEAKAAAAKSTKKQSPKVAKGETKVGKK
jgi:large subunit ribosomal protein L24